MCTANFLLQRIGIIFGLVDPNLLNKTNMQNIPDIRAVPSHDAKSESIAVTVIVPTRNEARHLARCLEAIRGFSEVYVVDSQSTDSTVDVARAFGAKVVQFHYHGGWPKKRQWALDTLPFENEWVLLLDADEVVTPGLAHEIEEAIRDPNRVGYRIFLRINFLGRELRFGGNGFWKMSLFRHDKGHFECRLRDQDTSMSDIEVHEHVVVDGCDGLLRQSLPHHNVESLERYLAKHNEYSNWEAKVLLQSTGQSDELPPALFGNQAQRRRWLKKRIFGLPGSPLFFFLYKYVLRLGFLDGVPGLIYCVLQSTYMFHIKAKIYELQHSATSSQQRT
jgi:glycosyltransferase involved in cell wall biosynthesis